MPKKSKPIIKPKLAEAEPSGPAMRGEFLICSLPPEMISGELIANAMCVFKEREGITLIVPESSRKLLPQHAKSSEALVLISADSRIDSGDMGSLQAVIHALADEGIRAHVFSSFRRENFFVPRARAPEALKIITSAVFSE